MEVFVVVILHLSMFFIHNFFLTSFVTLPWTIARFLHPFCTFSPVHRRVIRDFIFRPFHDLLTASATVLSGHFLPTSVFYLALLPHILAYFVTQMRAETPHPGSSSVPALTELSLAAEAWTGAYSYCRYKTIDLSIAPVTHEIYSKN